MTGTDVGVEDPFEAARHAIESSSAAQIRAALRAVEPALAADPQRWLRWMFPSSVRHPFAAHHREFLDWVWSVEAGERAEPFVAIWPRGGAKSSLAEIATVAVAARGVRRYGLVVSATQRRADDHVGNIGHLLESVRVAELYPTLSERQVGKFGAARGWRRNRVRTAAGFTVDAIGLDAAVRGVKLDDARPDFIVLDDLDDALDSPRMTERKITALSRTILPAQAEHSAVLAVQNLVLPQGVFARLAGTASQTAEFLVRRHLSGPVPAITGLEIQRDDTGRAVIAAGEATWAGQDVPRCQSLLDEIGERAFRIECQHEVELRTSGMFDRGWWRYIDPEAVPAQGTRWVRYWDLASTRPVERNPGRDPDWSAGALVGLGPDGMFYIADIKRFRDTPRGKEVTIAEIAERDAERYTRTIWIEQEPGSASIDLFDHYRRKVLPGYEVRADRKSGAVDSKISRATPVSAGAEAGNYFVVRGDWNDAFVAEAEVFPDGDHDDQLDAVSGAVWALSRRRARLIV